MHRMPASRNRSRTRIRDLEGRRPSPQRALALEMNRLVEANRKVRLVENLKQRDEGRWRREFERELAAFADEAFLGCMPSTIR